MRIDAHHHFWKYDPVEYGWINNAMRVIRRDFLPAELKSTSTPFLLPSRNESAIRPSSARSSDMVSATVSSTPPTLETSPATWNPPLVRAASANRAERV